MKVIVTAVVSLGLAFSSVCFASPEVNEVEINLKSTFILKFCQYIEWPEYVFVKPDSPIIIAVAGDMDQIDNLASMALNVQCKGRPFRVYSVDLNNQYVTHAPHILYVTRGANRQSSYGILEFGNIPILTVTDTMDGETDTAGIINFKKIENRIRFDISLYKAKQQGIHIASPLLAVADKVDGGDSHEK